MRCTGEPRLQGKDVLLALRLDLMPGVGRGAQDDNEGSLTVLVTAKNLKLIPVVPKRPYVLLPPADGPRWGGHSTGWPLALIPQLTALLD